MNLCFFLISITSSTGYSRHTTDDLNHGLQMNLRDDEVVVELKCEHKINDETSKDDRNLSKYIQEIQ